MTQLDDACDTITRLLPQARELITEPDTDNTTTTHAQPGSRPPWNTAAANATMDAHEGLRRLEASIRRDALGHLGNRRPGDDANTYKAIAAIQNLGNAITTDAAAQAARILDRWSRAIQQLPAIDTDEPWQRRKAPCPYCQLPMLRIRPRAGEVTCIRYGTCRDDNGRHPFGRLDVSRTTSEPSIYWNDGRIT
jgi:hypothetical protein